MAKLQLGIYRNNYNNNNDLSNGNSSVKAWAPNWIQWKHLKIDSYLELQRWESSDWSVSRSVWMTGSVVEVYVRLPGDDSMD